MAFQGEITVKRCNMQRPRNQHERTSGYDIRTGDYNRKRAGRDTGNDREKSQPVV